MTALPQDAAATSRVEDQRPTDRASERPLAELALLAGYRPALMMAAGGLLAGILLGGLQSIPAQVGGIPSLEGVAKSQLEDAILSMGPTTQATAAANDARQCKAPLAYLTVSAEAGAASAIRIRSGNFLSPQILVTPSPRRVAIPFPAPYPSGKGVLVVEGEAHGLTLWLTPATHYTKLNGPAAINVVWSPTVPPC